jgi:hypothetical protein
MLAHELQILAAKEQTELLFAPFHQWVAEDESVWCQFYRIDNNYLLRFPELADFKIDSQHSSVQCWPVPDVAAATINQLYLNQLLPLLLSYQGKLVFHASAIEIGGLAIAFMGISGRGKSTLAASFSSNHYRFLTDDGLILERAANNYQAVPSHPSIRLWDDSQNAVLNSETPAEAALDYTSKLRFPASRDMVFCQIPCLLHRIYFLGDGSASEIQFTMLSPREVMVELIKHSFLLDIEDREMLKEHFAAVSHLASLPIFFKLDYPRDYSELENLRHSIVNHAKLINAMPATQP